MTQSISRVNQSVSRAATPLICTGMLSFEEALPVLYGLICISKDEAQLLLDLTDRDLQT